MTSSMAHLVRLCAVRPDRRVGGEGNRAAVRYVESQLRALNWSPQLQWFDCLDWESDGGEVHVAGQTYAVVPAPYGVGAWTHGPLVAAATATELEKCDTSGAVLLLHGALTTQPLTPRNYPFYSSAEDEWVLRLIEASGAVAVVAVTGRCPEMCGALDPFPFIEDGSVDLPVASVGTAIGDELLSHVGRTAAVSLRSRRRPSRGANVVARRGPQDRRVTVVAHIDTKPGTPGALDNGTGVVTVLKVAEALRDERFERGTGVELLVVNGEDAYSAAATSPGPTSRVWRWRSTPTGWACRTGPPRGRCTSAHRSWTGGCDGRWPAAPAWPRARRGSRATTRSSRCGAARPWP